MAGKLRFKATEVLRLIDHALAAETHSGDYNLAFQKFGQRYIKSEVSEAEYQEWYKTLPPALLLVKDQGCYLMSNGLPALPVGENCAYAEGLSARELRDNFDAVWDKQEICGGDDFVETIQIRCFRNVRDRRAQADKLTVIVELTENSLAIQLAQSKEKPNEPELYYHVWVPEPIGWVVCKKARCVCRGYPEARPRPGRRTRAGGAAPGPLAQAWRHRRHSPEPDPDGAARPPAKPADDAGGRARTCWRRAGKACPAARPAQYPSRQNPAA